MGRPAATAERPYLFQSAGVWESNVRGAKAKRTYVGSYPTREGAEAAANHFIATGQKPAPGMFGGATRTGPKGPNRVKRQNSPLKTVSAAKPRKIAQRHQGEAAAQKPEANRLSYEDRIARWRAAYQKVCSE